MENVARRVSESPDKTPTPEERSQWEPWFQPRAFALGLAGLVIVSWWEVLFGFGTFALGDFDVFGYPLAHYHRESFWRGEIPLWNPHNNCGLPFLAQWNSLVLYPPSLFYVLFPLSWSLGMFCVLHLYAGGLGMYFLARHWTGHTLGAAVAGVAFAFSGLTQTALMWPNNSAALGWLPWILLLTEFGWQRGGRWLAGATIAGAMQMLTGAPEIILCTWLVVLLNLVFGLSGSDQVVPWKTSLPRLGFMVVLVSGLCAAQLIPFFELLEQSQRDASYGDERWAAGPFVWANYLVPLFRTITDSVGVHYHVDQQWVISTYGGITVLFLALVGGLRIRERSTIGLSVIGLTALILAMGAKGGLYALLENVIPLGVMRYPAKFLLFVSVALPLLAAFGIREILGSRQFAVGLGITVVGWSVAVLLICALPIPEEDPIAALKNGFVRLAYLGIGIFFLRTTGDNRARTVHRWTAALLVGAIWADLKSQQPSLTPAVDRQVYDTQIPMLKDLKPRPVHGTGRAALTTRALSELRRKTLPDLNETTVLHRIGMYDNLNLLDGHSKIDGIYSLYLSRQQAAESMLPVEMDHLREPMADFLGVNQQPSATNIFHWQPRTNAMPLITAGQAPVFLNDNDTMGLMLSEQFAPRTQVLLPLSAKESVAASTDLPALVKVEELHPHLIRFRVHATTNTMAVLSQAQFHPWEARVNGEPAPIVMANLAFQAVAVPAGESVVELTYNDRGFRLGAIISILSLILTGLLWWKSGPQSGRDSVTTT